MNNIALIIVQVAWVHAWGRISQSNSLMFTTNRLLFIQWKHSRDSLKLMPLKLSV